MVRKNANPVAALRLDTAKPERLVETLKNVNMFWRLQAQRLLVERGKTDVVPALLKSVANESVDELGLNAGVTHSVWTLSGLAVLANKKFDTGAVSGLLEHPSPSVHLNTINALQGSLDGSRWIEDHVAGSTWSVRDQRVKLGLFLALAESTLQDNIAPHLAVNRLSEEE